MCGIVGFYGSGNQKLISTMAEVMHKRGPDETGFYVNETEKVYLGPAESMSKSKKKYCKSKKNN